jgi:UDP-glucose 4-epimerase
MKSFLVTGASGYIGSHMCYELKQTYPDCRIIAIDKVRKNKLNHLYDKFILCDMSKSIQPLITEKVDCVFHFASYTVVSESQEKPYKYYQNNLMSSLNLIEHAIHSHVKNFVFSSSCSVYGSTDKETIDETSEKNPQSVYAHTKSIVEDILQAASKEHGMNVSCLRYFNAAGRNVEANLFEEHDPETHLIPILVKEQSIKIYGDEYDTPDGSAIRDYIHVVDLCKAHIASYDYMIKNEKGITCNIGTGQGTSVFELVELVSETFDKYFSVIHMKPRFGDVPRLVSNTEKMRNDLTFQPEHDIVSIIESMRN